MEYTYTEEDLNRTVQQMKNNGCLPPMAHGYWVIQDDGGIGHYYLALQDDEGFYHSQTMLGENVDAAYLALQAIDRLRILTFSESVEGVDRRTELWQRIMEE